MSAKKYGGYLTLFTVLAALTGCDGSGGSSVSTLAVNGSGVKGPMAGALVNLYQVDLSKPDLRGAKIDAGETGADARIQDLQAPAGLSGPVLLEFVADADTIDLTTGAKPIFSMLETVVDAQRLQNGDPIFASPLTTMAVKLASRKADSGSPYAGDGNGQISSDEFIAALAVAQGQVKSTFGFGLTAATDIFTAPPLITDQTTDATSQTEVAAYRQAIEAVGAISKAVSDGGGGDSAEAAFDALTEDLTDGVIDGKGDQGDVAALQPVSSSLTATVTQDVTSMKIPGTAIAIGDIETVLVNETQDTGATTDTTALASGQVSVDPQPAAVMADADDDGTPDAQDAFPNDPTETTDSDQDGVGDNADAFPEDPSETADSDRDGTGDNADAFPQDPTETTDSDGDGVGDNADAFPQDPTETVDSDGDGVGDNADAFPQDPNLSADTDQDGVGDAVDNCVSVPNPSQADSDGDGIGDACDSGLSTLNWDDQATTWDNANWAQ